MGRACALTVMALGATTGWAEDGLYSARFGDGACVSLTITSPEWARNHIKRKAKEEYREVTASERAQITAAAFQITVWNDEELLCRDIRPTAVVVTDPADKARVRFDLANPERELKMNAFGVTGGFYTATIRPVRKTIRAAFGEDGVLHVLTSAGKRSAPFSAREIADDVGYETESERAARRADDNAATEHQRKTDITERMMLACIEEPTAAGIQFSAVADLIGTVPRAEAAGMLRPYVECLEREAKGAHNAEAEANRLLALTRGE